MTPEEKLMLSIKTKWDPLITLQCQLSSVPPMFIAALIANESGGNDLCKPRFEPNVYRRFQEVLAGKRVKYNGLGLARLKELWPKQINDISTSWGLTQIMGYHALKDGEQPEKLKDPEYALHLTLKLLSQFAESFGLDLRNDFAELFTCWNTGKKNGTTHDPKYVSNGILRMRIYETINQTDVVAMKICEAILDTKL